MSARLWIVTGTGTEIGKTHLSCALLRAFSRLLSPTAGSSPRVVGLKPIESGVPAGAIGPDAAALAAASTFHVKHSPAPYALGRAVSPHLAAREEGRVIDVAVVRDWVFATSKDADIVVVELPGGLFSPIAPGQTNASLLKALPVDRTLLVAPDRLGVLHDVAAADRAARSEGIALSGVLLSTPELVDLSTGTNAQELPFVTELPILATLPRASVDELAQDPQLLASLRTLL